MALVESLQVFKRTVHNAEPRREVDHVLLTYVVLRVIVDLCVAHLSVQERLVVFSFMLVKIDYGLSAIASLDPVDMVKY
jgi:hypothetical protein